MKRLIRLICCLIMVLSMTACSGSQDGGSANELPEYTIDEQAVTLTIMGADHEDTVYSAEDIEKMGLTEVTYSGRNKKVQNARQFITYRGIDVKTLLKKAGYETEGASLKVICSDGYTREYDVEDDLYGKYTFADNETDNKTEVMPMIAIVTDDADSEYPAPFKLVYGQEDYDTNKSQDFNMQGWARYLQCIQVSYQ